MISRSRIGIFLSLTIIGVLLLLYLSESKDTVPDNGISKTVSLVWMDYAPPTPETGGYLLSLKKSSDDRTGVYIATDKELEGSGTYIDDTWVANTVSYSHIWNPRICAQMPSAITDDGDIYMYDVRRLGSGVYQSYLIWFDAESKTIKEVKVDLGDYLGKVLFKNETGRPWFMVNDSGSLIGVTINADNTLQFSELRTILPTEQVTVSMNERREPVIEVFDTEKLKETTYVMKDSFLQTTDSSPSPYVIQYKENKYAIHDLGAKMQATYTLNDPYSTDISYNGTSVIEFVTDAKIYSYVLGSF